MIPLPEVPTLFLDVKTAEDITGLQGALASARLQRFKLHQVVYIGASPPVRQVALPRLQGKTVFHWAPNRNRC